MNTVIQEGSVIISISEYEDLKNKFQKDFEEFNEEVRKLEKGLIKTFIGYPNYKTFVSKDEAIKIVVEEFGMRERILEEAHKEEIDKIRKMNIFQFLKWKKLNKK